MFPRGLSFNGSSFYPELKFMFQIFALVLLLADNNQSALISKLTREYIISPFVLSLTNSVIFVARQPLNFRCSRETARCIFDVMSWTARVSGGGFNRPCCSTPPPHQPWKVKLLIASLVVTAETCGCGRRIYFTRIRTASRVTLIAHTRNTYTYNRLRAEYQIPFHWENLLYAIHYTVGPWLTNSIRSRGLVVTQVGRKSRLFFS
jgi:hypothetical protein